MIGNKKKLLVVIDVQNDFFTNALRNEDAIAIKDDIVDFIEKWDDDIIATKDTHYDDYLETLEGKLLPVQHCIKFTDGWNYVKEVEDAMNEKEMKFKGYIEKNTFGSFDLLDFIDNYYAIKNEEVGEITVIGVCTDICVISNVLLLRAKYPNMTIKVIEPLCAGVTKEKHNAAIETMKSCQVEVIDNE